MVSVIACSCAAGRSAELIVVIDVAIGAATVVEVAGAVEVVESRPIVVATGLVEGVAWPRGRCQDNGSEHDQCAAVVS